MHLSLGKPCFNEVCRETERVRFVLSGIDAAMTIKEGKGQGVCKAGESERCDWLTGPVRLIYNRQTGRRGVTWTGGVDVTRDPLGL